MPWQWCFHVGCGFSCVHGRTKGRGSQNLGTRNLVPTAEGHPVGVSGRSWAHFDGNWCGLDAGTTKDCARVDPGGRRPQTRGRCENCHLATPKSIFRTHRKGPPNIFPRPPSHELQNEPPWAFISARYQNLYGITPNNYGRVWCADPNESGPWGHHQASFPDWHGMASALNDMQGVLGWSTAAPWVPHGPK